MPALGGDRFSSLRTFSLQLSFLFWRHTTLAVAAPSLIQSIKQSIMMSSHKLRREKLFKSSYGFEDTRCVFFSKFKLIKGNWFKYILGLEDKFNRNLKKIQNKLTDATYIYFFASGSTPDVSYGLTNIYEVGCPIKPISSAINTFNGKEP